MQNKMHVMQIKFMQYWIAFLSIWPVSFNSCHCLRETKLHSSLFLHWSGSKFPVVMAACTPSIHVFLGRPLFFLSHGIQSIINCGVLSSGILSTWPYHCSLFFFLMSVMSSFPFISIISFICSFFLSFPLFPLYVHFYSFHP